MEIPFTVQQAEAWACCECEVEDTCRDFWWEACMWSSWKSLLMNLAVTLSCTYRSVKQRSINSEALKLGMSDCDRYFSPTFTLPSVLLAPCYVGH
jgi:hypothetical protein